MNETDVVMMLQIYDGQTQSGLEYNDEMKRYISIIAVQITWDYTASPPIYGQTVLPAETCTAEDFNRTE